VNLLGEHTDYTGGYVMPMATDLRTTFDAEPAAHVDVYSATVDARGGFDPADFEPDGSWLDYLKGVYHVLQSEGYDPGGFHGELDGDLPTGTGLSSSASLELAVLAFLNEAYDLGLTREEMALLGQRVENEYVGVSCGIMDQFAVALCEADCALQIDTETLEYDPVALPDDVQIVVFRTGVDRELRGSAYNERRETVEGALEQLGRATSKDLADADFEALSALERRRLGYLRRENERVPRASAALTDGALETFGDILVDAHRDIAENYEASCVELDFLVETAIDLGAYGARLTGAGWGGAAIAVVDAADADSLAHRLQAAYETQFPNRDSAYYLVEPSAGVQIERRE
jgi:galactokinase